MIIYLAGVTQLITTLQKVNPYFIEETKPFVLESYYYVSKNISTFKKYQPYFREFLLDSGAFTFMQNSTVRVDWIEYAKRYADFINKNNIEKYIELDLDYIIGVDKAFQLRQLLEAETGKKSVPVWHRCRGKEAFLEMCDDYDYVALGGIVGQRWRGVEQYMPWFINEAHNRGAKIHGLGFTKQQLLTDYHFDSVDSTSWTTGNRFGYVWEFTGRRVHKINKPSNSMISNYQQLMMHNYMAWYKYQQWAYTHL